MSLGSKLHVVTTITNPARYRTRYELYRQFEERMLRAGVQLWTVEAAFGERPHGVTTAGNPHHIQLRTTHELWHKENLLNIGISRLPADWQYVAIIDADLTFARHDWAEETVQQLQHTPIVQMFSEVSNLSPTNELLGHGISFVEAWKRGVMLKTPRGSASTSVYFHPKQLQAGGLWSGQAIGYPAREDAMATTGGNQELGSPGGAWAYTRQAFDQIGGLIDYSTIGSADYFMAAGLFGLMHLVIHPGYSPSFLSSLFAWQDRALRTIRHNVGVVPGLLLHHWHGRMTQRGYGDRWRLLVDHQVNPTTDLVRDAQGVLQLHDDGSDRARKLRDDLCSYFRSRNEDSIDL